MILLSAMAIGAIAFLAFSVAGMGKTVVSKMTAPPREADETRSSPSLPLELLADPFSHPKLTMAAVTEAAKQGTTPPDGTTMPPALSGNLSGLGGFGPIRLGPVEGGTQPDDDAGKSRNLEGSPRLSVALSAIVKVHRAVALLSLNHGETRAYRKGDLVCPGLRLVEIGGASVWMRTPNKTFELKVGGEATP